MKSRLLYISKYLFFLGLGLFLAWWSVRELDDEKKILIKSAMRNARYYLIIPVFFILIMSHFIRSLRWRLLIEPLGYKPTIHNTFFSVMIGYLANQAVPRLGEVLKCTMLSRYEKVPADKLIGTIILERIIDALTLLLVFAVTLALQPGLYSQLIDTMFHSEPDPAKEANKIPGYVWLLIFAGAVLLFIIIWMIVKKKNIADIRALLKKIWRSVIQGVSTVQHLKKRGLFAFYTILMWSLYFAGGYIGFYALQQTEQYGVKEAFSILSAGSIGMIMTPGGIGAYPFLIERTMLLYNLDKGIGLAFGWLLWLAQTGVVVTGGLFSFAAIPYFNKKKKQN